MRRLPGSQKGGWCLGADCSKVATKERFDDENQGGKSHMEGLHLWLRWTGTTVQDDAKELGDQHAGLTLSLSVLLDSF